MKIIWLIALAIAVSPLVLAAVVVLVLFSIYVWDSLVLWKWRFDWWLLLKSLSGKSFIRAAIWKSFNTEKRRACKFD